MENLRSVAVQRIRVFTVTRAVPEGQTHAQGVVLREGKEGRRGEEGAKQAEKCGGRREKREGKGSERRSRGRCAVRRPRTALERSAGNDGSGCRKRKGAAKAMRRGGEGAEARKKCGRRCAGKLGKTQTRRGMEGKYGEEDISLRPSGVRRGKPRACRRRKGRRGTFCREGHERFPPPLSPVGTGLPEPAV